jgi:hypothetical protein
MKKLKEKKQELAELKRMHESMWDTYGSELCAGDMHSKEEELEEEIALLEEKDTTMYIVEDGTSYKQANSVAIYSSDIGTGIHFDGKPTIYDGNLIDSDSPRFWDTLRKESNRLERELRDYTHKLRNIEHNIELINKAYERRED